MPLTLSHPAAVLPLRRLGLPVSAMVAGSMVLDVPLYLGSRRGYEIAHSPAALATVDVVATLLVLWVWFAWLRDPLADLAPSPVRDRIARRARLSREQWRLAPIGAVVGAVTHVVWDSFTHEGQWGYEAVGWLQQEHLGIAGLRWSQYVSAIGGLTVIAAFVAADLRTATVRETPRRVLPAPALPVVGALAVVAAGTGGLAQATDGLHAVAFAGAVAGVITLAAGLLALCATWHVVARRSSR